MSEEIKNLESVLTFNGRPIMTPSRAKEVLEGMNLGVFSPRYLAGCDRNISGAFNAETVRLNGNFTPDQLQAIALWMTDPEGVTNA